MLQFYGEKDVIIADNAFVKLNKKTIVAELKIALDIIIFSLLCYLYVIEKNLTC